MIAPVPAITGPLEVFEDPIAGLEYVIGADTSEGVRGGDYCAAVVIRADDCSVVATLHEHVDATRWGRKCSELAYWYNTATLAFETFPTAYGLAACRAALDYGYSRLYQRVMVTTAETNPTEKLGWHTDRATSGIMLSRVRMAIKEGSPIASAKLLFELASMKFDEVGDIFSEGHDDLYDAYAIALCVRDESVMRNHISAAPPKPRTETERFWDHVQSRAVAKERDKHYVRWSDGGLG